MLTRVDIKDFDKLKGIIERNITHCNVGERTSFEYVKATATLFAMQDNVAVWTDDLDDPKVLLIITSGKFGVLNETFAFINTVYVDDDHRSPRLMEEIQETATMWARSKNCTTLQVSSWTYRGSEDSSNLWKSLGFEIQETIYIKKL